VKTLFIAILFAASAALFAADEKFGEISHADLLAAISAKSVVVIDVNGTDSYAACHIPGALDFDAVKDLAKRLPADKNALIVAYCGSPTCGAWHEGAEAVSALGYTNVKHYKNGISGWKASGAAVEVAAK